MHVQANVGVPMLALVLPGMTVSLIPIVILETWYVQKCLQIPIRRALKAMAIANLASTFIGIPFAWIIWVMIGMAFAHFGYSIRKNLNISTPGIFGAIFSLTIGAAWIGPSENNSFWMIPLASLVQLIPYFYVSWYLERAMAKKLLKDIEGEKINNVTFTANLYSYCMLAALIVIWLVISIVQRLTMYLS